ncbi:hypothetical protein [Helicobacter sp. 11S02596-1]|uniref:hypothetical protein n=1 Tax=Helicobacter sp. 11S02596-1 TaxID=1476194 RepID=UPI0015E03DD5|nr:hypothetical protein [Helicobacter sp. 11S02596-1]
MQAIDWVGIVLFAGVMVFLVYRLLGMKKDSKGCGCGGGGKCSKPKVYHTEDKKS